MFLADEDGNHAPAWVSSNASLVVLSADIHPEKIGARLGLMADRWFLRGEFEAHPKGDRGKRSRPFPFNGWQLKSTLADTAAPNEHLADLLDRLESAVPSLADLASDPQIHSIRLWLGYHTDNENPGISLSPELVTRIAKLGTGIELDIYVESSGDDPED